jgi:hypothetical protein
MQREQLVIADSTVVEGPERLLGERSQRRTSRMAKASIFVVIRCSASMLQSSQAVSAADARLDQSVASLAQSMNGPMATVAQMMAKGIRQQVGAGKFSPAGARRASGIANSLMTAA